MVYILGTDFFFEVAKGKVVGHKAVIITAHNDNVSSAAEEDIWEEGGHLIKLTSAETMNIVSDNVGDDSDKDGARTVIISGLDGDYKDINEVITMNGTSNVETSKSYIRVRSLATRTAGSTITNSGAITATASSASTVQCKIDNGNGQSANIHYTVPTGKKSYIIRLDLNTQKTTGGQSPIVHFLGHVQPKGGAEIVAFDNHIDSSVQNFLTLEQPIMPALASGADIRIDADTDQNDTIAGARFYIIEVDDDLD